MNHEEPIVDDQQSIASSLANSSFSFDSLENSSESAESMENLTKITELNFDDSIPHYSFTASERSQAMSVVAVGALLANFPIVILINWHGNISNSDENIWSDFQVLEFHLHCLALLALL